MWGIPNFSFDPSTPPPLRPRLCKPQRRPPRRQRQSRTPPSHRRMAQRGRVDCLLIGPSHGKHVGLPSPGSRISLLEEYHVQGFWLSQVIEP